MDAPVLNAGTQPARQIVMGNEIGNAWGWLLSSAPRIAKIIDAWPGTATVFTKVLRAIDLICRHYGYSPEEFGKRFDPEVTMNMHDRRIIISLREH